MPTKKWMLLLPCLAFCAVLGDCGLVSAAARTRAAANLVRSAASGPWSAATTWENGRLPQTGDRVQIRQGHHVEYDLASEQVIRSIHVAGTLGFSRDRTTLLAVGLIKIQAGDDASENGFDCEAHLAEPEPGTLRPALEAGTPRDPIRAEFTCTIRLTYVEGMDRETCPAIVCCGGRLDLHGAPMNRTWVKLGQTAKALDQSLSLAEPVEGWRAGDHLLITATVLGHAGGDRGGLSTEERTLTSLQAAQLTLDRGLSFEHFAEGDYRGEVANLSRNVIVESADPAGVRGHTMYHRHSAGSISYAEFRHLGKRGVLGKYSLHFHLVGDTMRGSSVVGASIWDSENRWLTIHGTNYLVVRDCVGYRSIGHGFFLEDGTEVFNVLDRNLAVQAMQGKPLPRQVLPFDGNEGSGFWWANSLNSFTRNVTCENERYGYRFDATATSVFDLNLPIQQPDGSLRTMDIRTLPFVRFEANEGHCDGLYGFNLGEGVQQVGPDARHPFIIRDMLLWQVHYGFRVQSPCVLTENMRIHQAAYGIYHPNFDRHVYRNLLISETDTEPFNRGHDDFSTQYGVLTVDGLTFAGERFSDMPLIQISDDNPTGQAESHFRQVRVVERHDDGRRALVNLGGGPRPDPTTPHGVPIYLHDWYGPNRHAKVTSTRAKDLGQDGLTYHEELALTGDESRVAEVHDVEFPTLLDPVDDLPPTTVITRVDRQADQLIVVGTSADNGRVARVLVNGQAAEMLADTTGEWRVVLTADPKSDVELTAQAVDDAGLLEPRPHVVRVPPQ